jgi:hypothetical protein
MFICYIYHDYTFLSLDLKADSTKLITSFNLIFILEKFLLKFFGKYVFLVSNIYYWKIMCPKERNRTPESESWI